MKASTLVQTILVTLTLFTFTTSFAAESAPPEGQEGAAPEAGRDVASKHKGKKKRHHGHGGRHGRHK